MGNNGSTSIKAQYLSTLLVFTEWGEDELRDMQIRSKQELSDVFALRKFEFEYLLGHELIGFLHARDLFENVFDCDRIGVADKYEVMCLICLLSCLSNQEKVEYLFDIFNLFLTSLLVCLYNLLFYFRFFFLKILLKTL